MGLWYQIIKPFNVSAGLFQLKKIWPITEIITGKLPANINKQNFLLDA